jgi:hypothetical protein
LKTTDVNICNGRGQTALLIAAKHNRLECIKILLQQREIDIDHQDVHGMTALHLAVRCNKPESTEIIEELLRSGADRYIVNRHKKRQEDAYHMATDHPRKIIHPIRKLFHNPWLVEVESNQLKDHLILGDPPEPFGVWACQKSDIIATELFYIKGKHNCERHLKVGKTVEKFIYAKKSVEGIFSSARPKDSGKELQPHCQWYHIPANNVSKDIALWRNYFN